jgi:Tfp pilus assembly protein PilF
MSGANMTLHRANVNATTPASNGCLATWIFACPRTVDNLASERPQHGEYMIRRKLDGELFKHTPKPEYVSYRTTVLVLWLVVLVAVNQTSSPSRCCGQSYPDITNLSRAITKDKLASALVLSPEQNTDELTLADLEKQTAAAATNASLHALLGYFHARNRNLVLAQRHTMRAVELSPREPDVWWCRAAMLARQGQANDAKQAYVTALRLTEEQLRAGNPLVHGRHYLSDWMEAYSRFLLDTLDSDDFEQSMRWHVGKLVDLMELLGKNNPTDKRVWYRVCDWMELLDRLGFRSHKELLRFADHWVENCTYLRKIASDQPEADTRVANAYSHLAWAELLNRHPRQAITAAEKGLAADPRQEWIKINQAHGYLFSGQFEKAQSIYLKNKNREIEYGGVKTSFWELVMNDFKTLREKGITHPDMARIEVWGVLK